MKSLNPTIEIGNPSDLALRQKVMLEDEVIVDRQADSLLGGFGLMLYGMFAYNRFPNDPGKNDDRYKYVWEPQDNSRGTIKYYSATGFSADTSVVPAEISASGSGFDDEGIYWDTPDVVTRELGGFSNGAMLSIETAAPELSGTFFVPHDDNAGTITLYTIDSFTRRGEIDSVTALDLTGKSVNAIDRFTAAWITTYGIEPVGRPDSHHEQLRGSRLMVGKDPSPNHIRKHIGSISNARFSTSGNSLAQPANSPNSSSMLLSRDFTNNNSNDYTVEEVWWLSSGFRMDSSPDATYPLAIARDPTQITVPGNSTITIQYKIECSNNGGGLMQMFMGLLYRHLSNTSFEVSRIGGTSVSRYPEKDFYVPGAGGYGRQDGGNLQYDILGPQVGTDDTTTDNSLESLVSRVTHGRDSGELLIGGSQLEPINKDYANDKYTFDVSRIFRNESGGPIDIKETGLYVGGGYEDGYPEDAHMIARHTPATKTVSNGEILEVTYTFEVALP